MSTTVCSGGRTVSWEELTGDVDRAAMGFHSLGVREGDAVALLLRNDIPYLAASLGAAKLGACTVPLNWHDRGEEIEYILRDSGAKVLVIHTDLLSGIAANVPAETAVIAVPTPEKIVAAYRLDPQARAVPDRVQEWEVWLAGLASWKLSPKPPRHSMIYTSGSTGRPKGVLRPPMTQEQMEGLTRMRRSVFGLRPGMRTVMATPLYHAAPNMYVLSALQAGGLVVLQPRFDAEELLSLIELHKISHLFMVPILFVRLLALPPEARRRYDLSSLEWVLHAAAPCPLDVKRAMIDWWGPLIHEAYAATELGWATVCDTQQWLAHPGTVGKPLSGAEVRILAEQGEILPPGEVGEVFVRQEALPEFTYHGREEDTRAVERGGLYTAGDMGWMNREGYLFLSDRKDDMVISGGVNIYPMEIENAIMTLPGVADCAVFGIPDEEYGEALAASVQLEPDASLAPDAIRRHVRKKLSRLKTPKVVEIMERLPRQESGKMFKRGLRDPFWKKAGRTT